jgi:hypothetical protein
MMQQLTILCHKAFFLVSMGVLCLIYTVASVRTNAVVFFIFVALDFTFGFLAGSFWQAGQGNASLAGKLQIVRPYSKQQFLDITDRVLRVVVLADLSSQYLDGICSLFRFSLLSISHSPFQLVIFHRWSRVRSRGVTVTELRKSKTHKCRGRYA